MRRLIALIACLTIPLVTATTCASSGDAGGAQPGASSGSSSGKKKKKDANVDPLYSLTLMRQGSVLMQQGRVNEALEQFREADRIAPGNATVFNMIGLCEMRLGALETALSSFDKALQLVPGFTDARNNRGATYLAMGEYHLAEVDFMAVLGDSTYPHRKQVYYNVGLSYLQRNQLGTAEENFRKAIILPSPVFDAYIRLAEIAQRQGDLDHAEDLLVEARLNFPDRIEVSFEMGKLLILQGRDDEARPYLEQVVEDAPNSESAETARSLLRALESK
jgi:Tfp pilus assembly protein PilF